MSIESVTVIPLQQCATNDWERVAETIVERTAEIVGGRVAVLDGLTAGERIVATPSAQLTEGTAVTIATDDARAPAPAGTAQQE